MDPGTLVPEALAVPFAPLVLQVLLVTTFTLHLLLMNVVVGGSVVALLAEWRERRTQGGGTPSPTAGLGHSLASQLTITLAMAVNLGVAPLLFLQVLYGQFVYTATVLMAWYWLGLVLLVILVYYGLYFFNFRYKQLGRHRPTLLVCCVLLLLGVAFLFSNVMTLMLRPEQWTAYFAAPGGLLLNLSEPTLLPRYLHMVVAALAVGGLYVAVAADFARRRGRLTPDLAQGRVRFGLDWFTRTTLLQLLVGPLFLLSLPREIMLIFMGRQPLATGLFVLALLLVLLVLYFGFKRRLWPTVLTLAPLVFIMSWLRSLLRSAYLVPHFRLEELAVNPQYGPFAMFAVSLVLGLVAVVWMLRLALRAGRETGKEA